MHGHHELLIIFNRHKSTSFALNQVVDLFPSASVSNCMVWHWRTLVNAWLLVTRVSWHVLVCEYPFSSLCHVVLTISWRITIQLHSLVRSRMYYCFEGVSSSFFFSHFEPLLGFLSFSHIKRRTTTIVRPCTRYLWSTACKRGGTVPLSFVVEAPAP